MSKCHKINTLEFKYFNQKRTPTILNKSVFTVVASRIIQFMIQQFMIKQNIREGRKDYRKAYNRRKKSIQWKLHWSNGKKPASKM